MRFDARWRDNYEWLHVMCVAQSQPCNQPINNNAVASYAECVPAAKPNPRS